MKKLKFGIIGCGNIGKRHQAILDAHERAEVVALCDKVIEKAQSVSDLYGGIKVYDNYLDMLDGHELDVVSVCTPHGLHAEMALEAAERKQSVLVEKPMALSSADCQKMIDAAIKNQVELMVVKQNRYNVPVVITRNALQEGKLGKVYMVQCNVMWNRNTEYYTQSDWRGEKDLEGGALFTQVSHFIDLLIWWFGNVTEARTSIQTKLHPIDVEDCGLSQVVFESGVMGDLFWTTCVYNKNYEGSITIVAEKGTVKIGGPYLNKIEFWDVKSAPLPENTLFTDKPNIYDKYKGTSSNHDKVIDGVISKMLKESNDVVEGYEGIKTVEAIEKIYEGT